MRLQGAIFGLDGTLLDSSSFWKTLGSDILRKQGCEPEPGLDDVLRTMSPQAGADYCRQHYQLPLTVEDILQQVEQRVDHFYRCEACAKPGVDKFLSILKMEGVWMYLATAANRPQAEAALQRTGLLHDFRGILTYSETATDRDSPVIFEKCLTRLRCRKEECVVFETAPHVLRTAKAAGFRVAAVYDETFQSQQLELQQLADYYIRSYDEFLQQEQ